MSIFLRSVLPALCFGLTTCSWATYFAVINARAEPIRVSYLARPLRTPPMLAATNELAESRQTWKELNVSGAQKDSAALTVVLGPDSALLVAVQPNYLGPGDGLNDWFEIKSLRIQTQFGERSYKGAEVPHAFEKRSRSLYVLE